MDARRMADEIGHIAGLDELIKLLERLKGLRSQSIPLDEFWRDMPLCSEPSLDEAKLCMAALNEVRIHLGRRIRLLHKAHTPLMLANGIDTLPDEILSQVFEAGHLMDTDGYRWGHLRICEPTAAKFLQDKGIVNLPCLKYLYHDIPINLTSWNLPSLSGIVGHFVQVPAVFATPSQLTSIELVFLESFDATSLSQALCSTTNLRCLALTLASCTSMDGDTLVVRPGHSVPLESMEIGIRGQTSWKVVQTLFDALFSFSASTTEIALHNLPNSDGPDSLYTSDNKIFPYGSEIKICVLEMVDPYGVWTNFSLLEEVVKGCNIAHTVHIEASVATMIDDPEKCTWESFSSLRHLHLKYCDQLTEREVEALVTNLMVGAEPGKGLQSLEIISCRGISEEFVLDLIYAAGPNKITWIPRCNKSLS
ncbi:hypothetical protein BD410DRAFT_804384 [Rickenella mellea]|uniref:F-box domain-containing protein n=1 Tax=Rickenella mellea TaxID=50990 RepID=A0A4Y7Q1I3_9AGAM|nr:hypothetical protein BD410DRAFT_804384 [Rickenella mellea]